MVEEHHKAGPFKNAMEAINSPSWSAAHKAIKESKRASRKAPRASVTVKGWANELQRKIDESNKSVRKPNARWNV